MTPMERSIRGRIAAFALHAQGGTNTGPARAAFLAKFEQEVDPEGLLPEGERYRRAEAAKRAYFAKLSLRRLRGERKNGTSENSK